MKYAITGTIGSGKSEVCRYLKEKGYHVFDCDKYNAYLLEKDNAGYRLVKEYFLECFDGENLDKKKLANIIFNDLDKKKKLESLLHPLIFEEIKREANLYNPFFAEVQLLFETGMDKYFDYKLLIVSDEYITLDRLLKRGMKKEDIERRINNQMSVNDKIERSDGIIYNNLDLIYLHKQIDLWLKKYVG